MISALERFQHALAESSAIIIGAGSGLSASAGLTYDGARFQQYFADFIQAYGFRDMYSAGFYPFPTPEEQWGYWSRHIFVNRYLDIPKPVYDQLLTLIKDKDYFVITTNVDHCFQRSGFDRERLFYTQGDYGLWQCSVPCHQETYDNEAAVRQMIAQQQDRRIPTALIPRCPRCGAPMSMNLRADHTFVEDAGWHAAHARYQEFLRTHLHQPLLFLELGVGGNTPGIIKYPFWQMTLKNPQAAYVTINNGQAQAPAVLQDRAICINDDIGAVLERIVG